MLVLFHRTVAESRHAVRRKLCTPIQRFSVEPSNVVWQCAKCWTSDVSHSPRHLTRGIGNNTPTSWWHSRFSEACHLALCSVHIIRVHGPWLAMLDSHEHGPYGHSCYPRIWLLFRSVHGTRWKIALHENDYTETVRMTRVCLLTRVSQMVTTG